MQISYHSVLTKIQKLQNLKKKKKKLFSVPVDIARNCPVRPVRGRYGRYKASMAGIFSGTKQGGRAYWIAGRYGIFRPYRPVRYGIENLGFDATFIKNIKSCQQHLSFYHFPNKMFLKIVLKPMSLRHFPFIYTIT